MHSTKIDLPLSVREPVCQLLNARLADVIDLQRQAKQAHWNVKGPQFIALHKLFDEISGSLDEHIDDIAERITALGGTALGTIQAVGHASTLTPYSTSIFSGRDHIAALSTALAAAGKTVRAAIDTATELRDADTADLFTGISRSLDQSLWFVEAHAQADA